MGKLIRGFLKHTSLKNLSKKCFSGNTCTILFSDFQSEWNRCWNVKSADTVTRSSNSFGSAFLIDQLWSKSSFTACRWSGGVLHFPHFGHLPFFVGVAERYDEQGLAYRLNISLKRLTHHIHGQRWTSPLENVSSRIYANLSNPFHLTFWIVQDLLVLHTDLGCVQTADGQANQRLPQTHKSKKLV